MVIAGLAGGLVGLGLALPTGLAFGYGYGYGVRMGYNAYKPSQNPEIQKLALSPNPIDGSKGAGLFAAEERTQKIQGLPLTDEPSLSVESSKVTAPQKMIESPLPGIAPRPKSSFKSHEDYVAFVRGQEPYKSQSRSYMLRHRTRTAPRVNYRYFH